jgi:hypothetical protein
MFNFFTKSYTINRLSSTDLDIIISECLKFCSENLGHNNRKRNPLKVVVDYNPYDEVYYGEYEPISNEIRIFKDEVKTIDLFCSVFIHEYTHFLQPIRSKYHKMLDIYGYEDHPFEIEANNNEEIYSNILVSKVKKLI